MNKKVKKAILSAGGAVLGAAAGGYVLCCLAGEILFNRRLKPSDKLSRKISSCDTAHLSDFLENNLKWVEDYGYETHHITSDRGEKLVGYMLKASKDSNIYAFCAHGYRSYGKKEFCGVCQHYLKRGINVFFPDHIASGNSEGKYCTFGYYESDDCIKWLQYLINNFGNDIKIFLHGVSMGSATVCMMSERTNLPENVKCIVADCGFTSATELYSTKAKEIINIEGKQLLKAMSKVNKHRLGFYYEDIQPVESVKNAKVPILFVHGEDDKLVPCEMVYKLYEACTHPKKELLVIKEADHAQAYFKGGKTYTNKLDEFLDKNI